MLVVQQGHDICLHSSRSSLQGQYLIWCVEFFFHRIPTVLPNMVGRVCQRGCPILKVVLFFTDARFFVMSEHPKGVHQRTMLNYMNLGCFPMLPHASPFILGDEILQNRYQRLQRSCEISEDSMLKRSGRPKIHHVKMTMMVVCWWCGDDG